MRQLGSETATTDEDTEKGTEEKAGGPHAEADLGCRPDAAGQPSEGLCRGRRRQGPARWPCGFCRGASTGRLPAPRSWAGGPGEGGFAQRTATPTPSSPPTIRAPEEGGGIARGPRKAGPQGALRFLLRVLQGEPFHLLSWKNGEEGREDPENNCVQIRREKERKAPHEVRRR